MNRNRTEWLQENQGGESVKFGVRVKTGPARTRHAGGVNWSVGSYIIVHCSVASMYMQASFFFK